MVTHRVLVPLWLPSRLEVDHQWCQQCALHRKFRFRGLGKHQLFASKFGWRSNEGHASRRHCPGTCLLDGFTTYLRSNAVSLSWWTTVVQPKEHSRLQCHEQCRVHRWLR